MLLTWVLAPGPPVGQFVPVQVSNLHDNALFLQLGKLRSRQKRGLHQQLDKGHSGQSIDHDAVAGRARIGDVVFGLKIRNGSSLQFLRPEQPPSLPEPQTGTQPTGVG